MAAFGATIQRTAAGPSARPDAGEDRGHPAPVSDAEDVPASPARMPRRAVEIHEGTGLAETVRIIGEPRTAWLWLVEPRRDGNAPIEDLKLDRIEAVLDAARENFA